MGEERIEIRKAVSIPSTQTNSLKADLFLPSANKRNGAAILLVFGGSWREGDRSQQRTYGLMLAKAGFTCLACDYRLSSIAHWPAQVEDISAAAYWLESQAQTLEIDPTRIGVSGNSSGGHLALMLSGLDQYWKPAAVCAFYPPTRLLPPGQPGHDEAFAQLMGHEAEDQDYAEASPVNCAKANNVPTLLIVGDEDSRVPPENTWSVYEKLKQANVKVELHSFSGLGHAFDLSRELAETCGRLMVGFFERNL
jgi:acetyl esterase/lipase